jgi:gamma-glutamylcysteine synthetase
MLYHHLSSYKNYGNLPIKFHNYPEYGMFSSASQVQLDVSYENLTKTINTFSKIEPIKALLFSNSVLTEENEDIICYRDLFWEHSTHGINPHNIGMFNSELDNVDDLLSYIETTSIYCVEREDKYINFTPIPVLDYLNKDSVEGEYYSNSKYEKITVKPNIKDLKYLRTFKFEDLTFRGTIEYRSVCCQPVKDSLTVAAFHLGLSENLDKLADLIENDHILYHHGYSATELRKMFIYNKIPNFLDKDSLRSLTKNILDISKEGLAKRNLNEEKLLDPLYKRNEADTNPAKTMLKLKSQGKSIEDIIIEYGKI